MCSYYTKVSNWDVIVLFKSGSNYELTDCEANQNPCMRHKSLKRKCLIEIKYMYCTLFSEFDTICMIQNVISLIQNVG